MTTDSVHSSDNQSAKTIKESLWEFVPLSEYNVPSLPARSAVARAWASITQLFKRRARDASDLVRDEDELHALVSSGLDHLVPPVDLSAAVAALNARISFSSEGGTVRFVVAQPYSGTEEIVRRWAEQFDAEVLAVPEPQEILWAPTDWSGRRNRSERPWVLPNLERCFLRHVAGLRTLRDLLEQVEAGCLGDGIICCDSWAWAYLQAVWPIPESEAMTLQAFDGSRFARLLLDTVTSPSDRTIHFRNAKTGKDILSVPNVDVVVTEEIAELVARCRGNVGLALSYWRERLRTEPEAEAKVDGKDAGEHEDDRETAEHENVWVSDFRDLPLPVDTGEDSALVLHALLLHGGLPAVMLSETLPLSRQRCVELLFGLRDAGFVKACSGRWSVAEAAYAAVRTFLSGRGYLVDRF